MSDDGCTCFDEKGDFTQEGELKCPVVWHCCDCGQEMGHKTGEFYARCRTCWTILDSKLF